MVQLVSQPFYFLLDQPSHLELWRRLTDTLEIVRLGDLMIVEQILHDQEVHVLLGAAFSVVRKDCLSVVPRTCEHTRKEANYLDQGGGLVVR